LQKQRSCALSSDRTHGRHERGPGVPLGQVRLAKDRDPHSRARPTPRGAYSRQSVAALHPCPQLVRLPPVSSRRPESDGLAGCGFQIASEFSVLIHGPLSSMKWAKPEASLPWFKGLECPPPTATAWRFARRSAFLFLNANLQVIVCFTAPGLGCPRWPATSHSCPRHSCPRQDSNLRTSLRRRVLYPLSYGGPGD
jgi:hypothetical protein